MLSIRYPLVVLGVAIVAVVLVATFVTPRQVAAPTATPLPTMVHPDVLAESWASETAPAVLIPAAGAIVNHHLLAATYIARTLKRIDPTRVKNILLISPDHFMHSTGFLTTTDRSWSTPADVMFGNTALVRQLVARGVQINDQPFSQEHGVANIIPFLKRAFPQATIVPLLVRPSAPLAYGLQQADAIAGIIDETTLVVGSFDFSHGHNSATADAHDAITMAALQEQAIDTFPTLDTDSPVGLAMVVRLMARRHASFQLVVHDNAARLTAQPSMTDVTSYIDGLFVQK